MIRTWRHYRHLKPDYVSQVIESDALLFRTSSAAGGEPLVECGSEVLRSAPCDYTNKIGASSDV